MTPSWVEILSWKFIVMMTYEPDNPFDDVIMTVTMAGTKATKYPKHVSYIPFFMMTSSNGNIFHVTGPLCGEFTGHRWNPLAKASGAEFWCFFYLCLNKRLSKQPWGWWFETPSRSQRAGFDDVTMVLRFVVLLWFGSDLFTHIAQGCPSGTGTTVPFEKNLKNLDMHGWS